METNGKDTFPTCFSLGDGMKPITTFELRMMKLSQEIREKENWIEKMNNQNILEQWKSEASAQGLTEDQIRYVFEELRYYASQCSGVITVGAVSRTWQADGLIEPDVKEAFKKAVYELENVDESEKDYHPWSNKQVVDLVHPSLFCYVEGVTKIDILDERIEHLEKKKSSDGTPSKTSSEDSKEVADKYQWLPAEFSVNTEGKVSIDSYINNLNPKKHETLYSLIAQIFEKFIPLFNRTLTDLLNFEDNVIIQIDVDWYKDDERRCPYSDDEPEYEAWHENRKIQWPKVPNFKPLERTNGTVDLKEKTLQVIVKLANIELTPENPKYPGGTWHVEGTENEAIVATGIYYFSSSNITESRLLFRQAIDTPGYNQDDDYGVKAVYGLKDLDFLNQEIGSILCIEDRCIVFPNLYQHKVAPFELTDRTRNGHRKILVFFLVNPSKRILSTKHVFPQQQSWFDDEKGEGSLNFTMTLEDARMYREKLMHSRKYVLYDALEGTNFFEREFSLCEH
ncbi:uncharacterized protein LOC105698320 [Orussus abietinus]|uniref:uncharacterized protein LOC105698320 n=1 Tax=Orussus abietinus TaxID=222816 RepID=UPI0006261AC0|nr:uncharacterized protein LOC105698320 [Orussus abietinus]